jgi:phosphoribosyl-AMP cyclohydrolase / phosphoribosyl-ATP pyrophosphohydrolase
MSLSLKFDAQGLVPAILQDHLTGQIRMFAYASPAAVRMTLETGLATYWSRSRGALWQRGRVGGHETRVVGVIADCDGDCLIYSSDPDSPSCHSGAPSCFFHVVEGDGLVQASEQPQTAFALLESTIDAHRAAGGASRPSSPPEVRASGLASKLFERVALLGQALERESDERVVEEAADAIYQLVVLLRARAISVRTVLGAVVRRVGVERARPA